MKSGWNFPRSERGCDRAGRLTVLYLVFLVLISGSSSASDTYSVGLGVSGGILNMRSGPGTNYPVVIAIPAGSTGLQRYECRAADDKSTKSWCHVRWAGRSGWVSSCCIIIAEASATSVHAPKRMPMDQGTKANDAAAVVYLYGDAPLLAHMIRAGVDLNRADEAGWTPLAYAAATNNASMARALLNAGAKPVRKPNSPLMVAAATGSIGVLDLLLRKVIGPGELNDALSVAAARGDDETVRSIITRIGVDAHTAAQIKEELARRIRGRLDLGSGMSSAAVLAALQFCLSAGIYRDTFCLSQKTARLLVASGKEH